MVSRTPPFKWPKHAKNDAFSTTKTTFSAWASVSGILVAASLIGIKCIHILGPHFSNDKCHTYTYIGSMIQGSCPPPFKLPKHIHAVSRTRFFLCVSPMAPDGVFYTHLQAGRNGTEFLNLTITEISSTKPRRANRNSQGSQRSWAQGTE